MSNSQETNSVRVRFAPSPTGFLHIGGARTALFNWLFARKNNGKFFLRIEDTDKQRSSQEMVDEILRSLKWMGLDWDDEAFFQSNRLEVYRARAKELVENRRAYHCFCEKEDKSSWQTKCTCDLLTVTEKEELFQAGKKPAIRFWVPDGTTVFKDNVYGSLEFNNAEIDNFVILRADETPTYYLAVVVDDYDMGITHIIRGDDHISNTPNQILLYHAFGWSLPQFAHVPLILGSDKKRLSKRHGATAVSEYFNSGILPQSLVNYLALLGWSPGDDREIFTLDELEKSFSLKGVSRKSAIFDSAKLDWVNSEHIKTQSSDKLVDLVFPFLKEAELVTDEEFEQKRDYLKNILDLFKNRMKTLGDLAKYGRYFFGDPERYDNNALKKYWKGNTKSYLTEYRSEIEKAVDFSAENAEHLLRQIADKIGIPAAKIIHPVRIVLTGFAVSPGLFEMMEVLGKETCLRRLDKGITEI
jgi:glutamyl-tRNA synthetase